MKNSQHLFSMAALAGTLAFAETAVKADVVNGSFEDPATVTTIEHVPGDSFGVTGWQAVVSGVERFDPTIYNVGPAQNGLLAIDLNTDHGVGGGITQRIDTVPGTSYRVSFYIGTWKSLNRDGVGRVTVVAGDTSKQFRIVNATGTLRWKPCSMVFKATADYTNLSFVNFSLAEENFSLLDDVSVEPLPPSP